MPALPHISVCICSYKRAELLKRLLEALNCQETEDRFTYSAVVVDNDALRSAESVVQQCKTRLGFPIEYFVEPRQNISMARNRCVAAARGDYLAFIDDDELPTDRWLVLLFSACTRFGADGVLAPVEPRFDEVPPSWVVKGAFYDRPSLRSGAVLQWPDCRTGNALLREHVFSKTEQPFRPELRGGEDRDFFRRKIKQGFEFVWCCDPVVHELVPPMRWKRRFMLRRALLRGAVALVSGANGPGDVLKSVVAVLAYGVVLPFALLFGQHRFMNILIRLFDHLGKVLARVGLNPVREPYITE